MIRYALALSALLAANTALADVSVDSPYARAVPPGLPNSAAFMTLTNSGDALSLIGGSSEAADVVELHNHLHENGVMKMRKVERIDLPANSTVTLKPGGLHMMLIGLKQQLKPGQQVEITLEFSDGSKQSLNVPVKSVKRGMAAKGEQGEGHKHHH